MVFTIEATSPKEQKKELNKAIDKALELENNVPANQRYVFLIGNAAYQIYGESLGYFKTAVNRRVSRYFDDFGQPGIRCGFPTS